jgi:hypothetical protein
MHVSRQWGINDDMFASYRMDELHTVRMQCLTMYQTARTAVQVITGKGVT